MPNKFFKYIKIITICVLSDLNYNICIFKFKKKTLHIHLNLNKQLKKENLVQENTKMFHYYNFKTRRIQIKTS